MKKFIGMMKYLYSFLKPIKEEELTSTVEGVNVSIPKHEFEKIEKEVREQNQKEKVDNEDLIKLLQAATKKVDETDESNEVKVEEVRSLSDVLEDQIVSPNSKKSSKSKKHPPLEKVSKEPKKK